MTVIDVLPRTAMTRFEQMDPLDLALNGFLARYRGSTAVEFRRDIEQYLAWCRGVGLPPLQATRPHVELYVRWMQSNISGQTGRPWSTATVNRRYTTVRLFYKYASIDDLVLKDPCAHVTPPRIDRDSQKRTWLNALEYGRLVAAAQEVSPTAYVLVWLLGTNALRISEACQVDIETMGRDTYGYETIQFVGKGSKAATVPLSVPVSRAIHWAIGDRTDGPVLRNRWGNRMDRAAAGRLLHKCALSASIGTEFSPHSLRRSAATILLQQGTPLREVQLLLRHASPDTTIVYDRGRGNSDRSATHQLASFISGIAT